VLSPATYVRIRRVWRQHLPRGHAEPVGTASPPGQSAIPLCCDTDSAAEASEGFSIRRTALRVRAPLLATANGGITDSAMVAAGLASPCRSTWRSLRRRAATAGMSLAGAVHAESGPSAAKGKANRVSADHERGYDWRAKACLYTRVVGRERTSNGG
jgi:hypothetical protein